jgi:hypothetical protein
MNWRRWCGIAGQVIVAVIQFLPLTPLFLNVSHGSSSVIHMLVVMFVPNDQYSNQGNLSQLSTRRMVQFNLKPEVKI